MPIFRQKLEVKKQIKYPFHWVGKEGKVIEVYRSEIHIIRKNHRLWKYCDDMCYKSKNLYNRTNWILMKQWEKHEHKMSAFDLNKLLKTEDCFKALPSKCSQQIIISLRGEWDSLFGSLCKFKNDKTNYTGSPHPPRYKKKNGRNIVYFDYQQGRFKDGKYYFQNRLHDKSIRYIETNINPVEYKQLQIIPYGSCYKIAIIYKITVPNTVQEDSWLAIDLGINNFATLTNNAGINPVIINGKIMKSINNYYNKLLAKAQSYAPHQSTHRTKQISTKHSNLMTDYMHKISRWIINYCLENGIWNIVIGHNKDWQRYVNLGKKNNQRFSQIPFDKFIKQLKYKGENAGINVETIEEQYTSKSSFIDGDNIPIKIKSKNAYKFSGERIKRGLYQSKDGTLINSDVNGSYNILRKRNPEFHWEDRIKGVALHPIMVNVT
jgi:putative transposase